MKNMRKAIAGLVLTMVLGGCTALDDGVSSGLSDGVSAAVSAFVEALAGQITDQWFGE